MIVNCLDVAGEASASTMWDNNAWVYFYDNTTEGGPPFLIQDFLHALQPHARFIVMLRDPVERWDRNSRKTIHHYDVADSNFSSLDEFSAKSLAVYEISIVTTSSILSVNKD